MEDTSFAWRLCHAIERDCECSGCGESEDQILLARRGVSPSRERWGTVRGQVVTQVEQA